MIEVQIPESVKVGGYDYTLDTSVFAQEELKASSKWAECIHSLRRLRLSLTGVSPQELSNTYIHELLHMIDVVYQNGQLTEDTVVVLANGLHQVLEQLGIRFVPRSDP